MFVLEWLPKKQFTERHLNTGRLWGSFSRNSTLRKVNEAGQKERLSMSQCQQIPSWILQGTLEL